MRRNIILSVVIAVLFFCAQFFWMGESFLTSLVSFSAILTGGILGELWHEKAKKRRN